VIEGQAQDLANNEDVKKFYLGVSGDDRKSFRDMKFYRRRKRWLACPLGICRNTPGRCPGHHSRALPRASLPP
jgi:hypothetical protein